MSGHSKWATIKHKKAAVDKARAKNFAKLIRQLEVAARSGGSDLNSNATLRTMYDKARAASVPTDTIDRAIKRGAGELEGVSYEAVTYEGYASEGVAVLVDALTDNRNRTSADIRHLFSKNGGAMAEPGAVAWQFERKGVVLVARSADEDELTLVAADAGAEDVVDEGEHWRVTCEPTDLNPVREAIEAAGMGPVEADLTKLAKATVSLDAVDAAKRVLRLVDALDEHDDVQDVWVNFDIPDKVLEAVGD
ncbi:MAG: YebC/PmpR family DNA-binding transcriptional regulator [Acidimicrobiia bacterium]|nr:YebC/PmpR family DNA-binding transcriptional regulator [Acidimicrobiia bacterium]